LVAIIDGLPGCGKNYLCGLIKIKGYLTADIDIWSQDVLKRTFRSFAQFQKSVKKEITDKIHDLLAKNPDEKFVLCGVSAMIFPDDDPEADVRTVDVFNCSDATNCKRFWLDISPSAEEFTCPPGYDPEMLETTRRAVLREFNPVEVKEWLGMDISRREEEGAFWTLARPGEMNGPKDIPESGVDESVRVALFKQPLKTFIRTYSEYFTAMLEGLIDDGYHENRQRALERGFVPYSQSEILNIL
jgi:hypothetical protein